ncbi:DNA-binding transcriptional regulator GbsR, MarR family [Desulfotomaculum arcticum]|uniref:HTH-type transcriptional regulator n=1 Tax=Desulfotruncus arcticus DSM 17038 TaxID=1121424 RepID=A0A1I2ZSV6_9FIRM|nr:GbsR/MarR family transcriptional regulator [Desulfotruncus arcticus]SFH40609.1 DNA-binding transcriptional regulator GbsR, MarR family [Desulfotomaculum arcticum] [Desulfotruncus arcticus DSM 17038]
MDKEEQKVNNTDAYNTELTGKVTKAKDKVINAMAETMDLYGVTPSVGRLYGTLYFQRLPMTLDEMKDELGMSKPSMSLAVRSLLEMKVVQKVWQKGNRKDLYVAEKDFFKFFQVFFTDKWRREIEVNLHAINDALLEIKASLEDPNLSGEKRQEVEELEDQIVKSKVYYHWLDDLVRSLESGHLFELIPPKK